MSDERTLRLAAPELTAAQLDAYLRYQAAWLERVEAGEPGGAVHTAALAEAGLLGSVFGALRAVSDDFCSRRWTAQRVESKAPVEAARLRDLKPLVERYGEGNVRLLVEREAALVSLNARVRAAMARS